MQGWIKLHRSMKAHWIMDDSEYLRAWVIILMEVNHTKKKVLVKKILLECNAGESLKSIESWGKSFGNWGRSRTQRFFDMLKSDGMIVLKSERVTTRLTVCNYATYQEQQTADSTAGDTADKQRTNSGAPTNKNDKNEENDKNDKKTTCMTFDSFWDLYGKKDGRKKCESAYGKIKESDRAKIELTVGKYVSSTPEVKFRKNPLTYLNGEHWNDEVAQQRSGRSVNNGLTDEQNSTYNKLF